jgi:hypothetical protein
MTDDDLFDRSLATLVKSWVYLAGGSPGAEVIETEGAAIATFVHSPDRGFLNNAVLARAVGDPEPVFDTVAAVRESRRRALRRLGARVGSGRCARGRSSWLRLRLLDAHDGDGDR